MKRIRRNTAGYSLLEVLVAFAIMMIVLSTLLPGQVELLGRATDRYEDVLAHEFALSLADALYHRVDITNFATIGTYADQWIWDIAIEDQSTQNDNVFLREATITVRNRADEILADVVSLKAVIK